MLKKVIPGMKIETFIPFWNKLLHWNLIKTWKVRLKVHYHFCIFIMFLDLVKEPFWVFNMENALDGKDWLIKELR